jgi:hypothetical protein
MRCSRSAVGAQSRHCVSSASSGAPVRSSAAASRSCQRARSCGSSVEATTSRKTRLRHASCPSARRSSQPSEMSASSPLANALSLRPSIACAASGYSASSIRLSARPMSCACFGKPSKRRSTPSRRLCGISDARLAGVCVVSACRLVRISLRNSGLPPVRSCKVRLPARRRRAGCPAARARAGRSPRA